jgi:Ca2+/H+ antiporter, TMEM165/GDT1 family
MRNIMRRRWIWMAPLAILGMIAFTVLGGEVVKLLWNWLLPGLFGWRLITFWQAIGLLALCRILFGRWGGRGWHRSNFRGRMRERWENMTPEDREKFRERWRGRCGGFEPPAEAKTTA